MSLDFIKRGNVEDFAHQLFSPPVDMHAYQRTQAESEGTWSSLKRSGLIILAVFFFLVLLLLLWHFLQRRQKFSNNVHNGDAPPDTSNTRTSHDCTCEKTKKSLEEIKQEISGLRNEVYSFSQSMYSDDINKLLASNR